MYHNSTAQTGMSLQLGAWDDLNGVDDQFESVFE